MYFLEIIISLFLFAMLLLGVDAMQITSLQQARNNYYFTVATYQLFAMVERLTAIPIHAWQQQVSEWHLADDELPHSKMTLNSNGAHAVLTLYWGDADKNRCDKNKIGRSGCAHLLLPYA